MGMGNIEKRIIRIEKRMGKPALLADLTCEEVLEMVCDQEWTDLELDTFCHDPLWSHFLLKPTA